MHRNGFFHRDIKPENFLVSYSDDSSMKFQIKLGDLGLAKECHFGADEHTEYVSTRWYRAPELIIGTSNYTQSVDVFALGCIIGELYLGRPMFPGTSQQDQLIKVVSVLGTPK